DINSNNFNGIKFISDSCATTTSNGTIQPKELELGMFPILTIEGTN
uniref:Uncharacterized protein n=1 Tax=Meloidogyne javanica TaxID=6303 RepID=A0A915M3Y2_MELJA